MIRVYIDNEDLEIICQGHANFENIACARVSTVMQTAIVYFGDEEIIDWDISNGYSFIKFAPEYEHTYELTVLMLLDLYDMYKSHIYVERI